MDNRDEQRKRPSEDALQPRQGREDSTPRIQLNASARLRLNAGTARVSGSAPSSVANPAQDSASTETKKAYDPEVLKTFLSYGLEAVKWHRDRGEQHERRAATLLGFVAATLALVGSLSTPLSKIQDQWPRYIAVGFAAVGVVFFIVSAVFAARSLRVITYKVTPPEYIIDQLEKYVKEPDQPDQDVTDIVGTLARTYIGRTADTSMLKSLSDNANRRGNLARSATHFILVGIGLISVTVITLLLNGALNPVAPSP